MSPIEALKVLQTIVTIVNFFESGTAANIISDIEFAAANKALSEIPVAINKTGQVHIAIGHLNSCYEANAQILRSELSSIKPWTFKSKEKVGYAIIRIRLALCLLAFCYAYLRDRSLCEKHLDLIEKTVISADEAMDLSGTLKKATSIAWFISPMYKIDGLGSVMRGIKGDFYNFEKANAISRDDLVKIKKQLLSIL